MQILKKETKKVDAQLMQVLKNDEISVMINTFCIKKAAS